MSFEAEYKKLKKKYKHLPDISWIKSRIRIEYEEGGLPAIEQLRIAIDHKLTFFARNIIEPIVSTNESFCCWFERKMINESEKKVLFENYKKMMSLLWRHTNLNLVSSEKSQADWIADVKKYLDANEKEMERIFDKISVGWKEYKKIDSETAYHG